VSVPASALFDYRLRSRRIFKALHKGITVHGLPASVLAFGDDKTSRYSPWRATWPSLQEFKYLCLILRPELLRGPLHSLRNSVFGVGIGEPSFILPRAVGGKRRNLIEYFDGRREARLLYRQEKKLRAGWETFRRFPRSGTARGPLLLPYC